MPSYRTFAPDVEVYSIDESFLDLSDVRERERLELARDLRSTVRRWTGLATCVGIGPPKTLAKLANHIAKSIPELGGHVLLTISWWLFHLSLATAVDPGPQVDSPIPRSAARSRRERPLAWASRTASARNSGVKRCFGSAIGNLVPHGKSSPLFRFFRTLRGTVAVTREAQADSRGG